MKSRQDLVQTFLDASHDPSFFCDGQIVDYSPCDLGPTLQPNCGVTEECFLYRPPRSSLDGPIRRCWPVPHGPPEGGCREYQFLRQWNADQQHWLVRFEGHDEQDVQAGNAQLAACTAWWESVRNGQPIDKMLLFNRRYTVREA